MAALLQQRFINAIFVLGEGDFGQAGQNTVELEGLRISVHVDNAGGRAMGSATARIYGMTLSQMNALSTLGMVVTAQRKNSVTFTGGVGKPLATFFQGTIKNAWAEFGQAPQVPFMVQAFTGLFDAVKPAQPISIRGSSGVAQMLSGLATQMGLAFENNGVQTRLANAYYDGSARSQALAIVRDAGIEWNGGETGVLAIWLPGQSRGGVVPVIRPPEMRGYPTYTANGIQVKTLFNPSLGLGRRVRVESSLKAATGEWVIYRIDHDLEALQPGGQWFSTILAAPPGLGPFVA